MAERRMGIIAFLFCLCLCLLPVGAQAASATGPIAPERDCVLILNYRGETGGYSGVTVKIYRIADVSADAQYTLTEPFADSGLTINGDLTTDEWNTVRTTLQAHILANEIEQTEDGVTNHAGQVSFDPLKPGMYLVEAERVVQDGTSCSFDSALISLPGLGIDGAWKYQVEVTSKFVVTPLPPQPPQPDDPGTGGSPGDGPVVDDPTIDGPVIDDPFVNDPDADDGVEYGLLLLWRDVNGQDDRPPYIEVEIFRDGISYQTVILSEQNGWCYSWRSQADGANWMVVQRHVPEGYYVTIEKRGNTFVLINTKIQEDAPEEQPEDVPSAPSPDTGDTSNILLYSLLMYGSGFLLVLLGLLGKRKRNEE